MSESAGTIQTVETTHGPLAVRRWGSGAPVVLLHPLALSGELWCPLAGALADEFEVLALDMRGHGGSGWDGRAFSVEDMTLDVAEVLDVLELPAVGMLGMSMGGSVAVTFAGLFPERVGSLVLADTTAWYGEDAASAWAERAERARGVSRAQQIPFQVDRWFSPSFQAKNPEEVDRVVQIFLRTASAAHAAASTAMGQLDVRRLLPGVRASTLVLVGEDDYATPLAMAEHLAQAIPSASLVTLPGLRHLSLVERPELADVVRHHFRGRPAADESSVANSRA
jgi:3-oxoadipate enol-lactonase